MSYSKTAFDENAFNQILEMTYSLCCFTKVVKSLITLTNY